ncbi:MAG: hypothetical protein OEZ01_06100, partial [Candidatus Heimdallarchaeota archaeon]|nr:hypothetical protein [Candidatus Heimdallarchaeota archaeon]
MIIKNTVKLTKEEIIDFFGFLAVNLEEKGTFEYNLKGNEAAIEVNSDCEVNLIISPNKFTIDFQWASTQSTQVDSDKNTSDQLESSEESNQYVEYRMVREVKFPDENTVEETTVEKREEDSISPSITPPNRVLPNRKQLNTTTLPSEGGYWKSSFTKEDNSSWDALDINKDLENKKWEPTEKSTLDLSPNRRTPDKKEDDDLFSDLGKLEDEHRTIKPSQIASSGMGVKSSIRQSQDTNTSSPQSSERLVKPSEFLKQKTQNQGSTISSPPQSKSTLEHSNQKISIPSPTSFSSKSTKSPDVVEWKEPSREENSTEDQWVKPSQLFKKKTADEEVIKKATRPPPKAPDA